MNEEGGEEEEPDNDEEIHAESSEMAPTKKGVERPNGMGPLEDGGGGEGVERPEGMGPLDDGWHEDLKKIGRSMALDATQDSQVPIFRHRSKKSLESLSMGGSHEVLPTPEKPLPSAQEEVLNKLMAEISLLEGGRASDAQHVRRDAVLLMMGSPPKMNAAKSSSHEG